MTNLKSRIDAYREATPLSALHITINNQNCADEHIEYCLQEAKEAGDAEGVAIARALATTDVRSRLIACGEDEATLDEATEATIYYNQNGEWPE